MRPGRCVGWYLASSNHRRTADFPYISSFVSIASFLSCNAGSVGSVAMPMLWLEQWNIKDTVTLLLTCLDPICSIAAAVDWSEPIVTWQPLITFAASTGDIQHKLTHTYTHTLSDADFISRMIYKHKYFISRMIHKHKYWLNKMLNQLIFTVIYL